MCCALYAQPMDEAGVSALELFKKNFSVSKSGDQAENGKPNAFITEL